MLLKAETCVQGVSARDIERIMAGLALAACRRCRFRAPPHSLMPASKGEFPYVIVTAHYEKIRIDGRRILEVPVSRPEICSSTNRATPPIPPDPENIENTACVA